MVRDDGSTAEGLDAIREIWAGFVALGGRIAMTTGAPSPPGRWRS